MNARQHFAEYLKGISAEKLVQLEQDHATRFEQAKVGGHCALEAVLYFDLQQVRAEVERREMTICPAASGRQAGR